MSIKFSPNFLSRILAELWENSIFDPKAYKLIEKIIHHTESNKTKSKIPPDIIPETLYELSTIRNRNLITGKEQNLLKNTIVGFFGLSVGSHAVINWVIESRANIVKISDPDFLSPTNLNRLRTGWKAIGKHKTEIVKEELNEINPGMKIISETRTDYDSMRQLFVNKPKLDIVIDEIDDLAGKVWLRKFAKDCKIPLISATDVGDNVVLDIERYDGKISPRPFLGKVVDLDFDKTDFTELSLREKIRITMQVVGFENCSEKMLDSLLEIGKTLKTWPQLGPTSSMAGGIVATTIKKIILKESVDSGRYEFSLDSALVNDYKSPMRIKKRKEKIMKFKKKYQIE